MPLLELQPDALADIYARSLYELADGRGGRQAIEATLAELEDILELARSDKSFGEFLSSRVLPITERSASLERIFSGRLSDLTLRFLQVLNEKGRLSRLTAVVGAYDRIVQEKFGRVEVDLYTPAPISPEELRTIRDRLQQALGKEPIIHPYVDHAMIGGIKMQIGDRLIDGSVASRLRQFRDRLANEGTAEIRSRAQTMFEDTDNS
jgi:F-type H+-transporting ATPase subunit delta